MRDVLRWLFGLFLLFAGTAHLTFARDEFAAQVPGWVPLGTTFVVVASGVVELGLGLALLAAPAAYRPAVGWVVAAFLVAVFPGNLAQYATGTDAFGLDSDRARLIRLLFQPVLIAWVLVACRSVGRRRTASRTGGLC